MCSILGNHRGFTSEFHLLDLVSNRALGHSSAHLVLAFPLPLLDVRVHLLQDRSIPAQQIPQVRMSLPASILDCKDSVHGL